MIEGTYLFKDTEDGEICLFLFMKFNKQQMDVALPNSIDDGQNGDYFIGIFRKGSDYLGKTVYSGIESFMKSQDMFDISTLDFDNVDIDELTEEEYDKYKDFTIKHMKTLNEIKKLVG